MNKKAVMDDLFDFMFTVFMAFFILVFISAFTTSAEQAEEDTTFVLLQSTSAVNGNLARYQVDVAQGNLVNLENLNQIVTDARTISSNEVG